MAISFRHICLCIWNDSINDDICCSIAKFTSAILPFDNVFIDKSISTNFETHNKNAEFSINCMFIKESNMKCIRDALIFLLSFSYAVVCMQIMCVHFYLYYSFSFWLFCATWISYIIVIVIGVNTSLCQLPITELPITYWLQTKLFEINIE